MTKSIIGAFLCALFCLSTSFAQTGSFTTDPVAWESTVCADNAFDLNYPSLVKFDGSAIPTGEFFNDPVPNGQDLGWGSPSQFSGLRPNGELQYSPDGVLVFVPSQDDSLFLTTPLVGAPIAHNLNPALGILEGFCFRYANLSADIRVYDGDTVVDSFTTVPGQFSVDAPETFICWENTNGVNVTRVEVETRSGQEDVNSVLFIIDGEFRFECDPEPTATCFSQLADVQAGVAALLADADDSDAYWAEGALDCIEWMQDDIFWDPSGDRLTQYGGTMFIGAAYTVCYLEYVDDPAADLLIDELLAVLECIVDNEIAYAIENGGNSCYIENAEHFANLGEIIDEDFDNQVVATLAYRLAWLHAYYATQ